MSSWGEHVLKIALANSHVTVPADAMDMPTGRHNKYNARITTVDGIKFASGAEARRYCELKILERAGEISGLELQPMFRLPGGIKYYADFRYIENGVVVVEDVKSEATAKNRTFINKWKQVQELHPDIDWRIVGA